MHRSEGQSVSHFFSYVAAIVAVLMVAGGLGDQVQAQHPTAVTSIVNSAQDTTLEVNHNGSLLMPGQRVTDGTESDSIPATGADTRLMWYPARAAFRAGEVTSSNWDPNNVGVHSAALGFNTRATGDATLAMGAFTTATGSDATALGRNTTATTSQPLSIGQCNSANTSTDNTLFVAGNGFFDIFAGSCNRSDALVLKKHGTLTTADSIESESGGFVLPDGTVLDEAGDLEGLPTNSNGAFDLTNDDGVVAPGRFGSGSIPTEGAGVRMMWYPRKAAFCAGRVGFFSGKEDVWDADSIGPYSVTFGRDTKASGLAATAFGDRTTASADYATAMGNQTTASGGYSTAMGLRTTASGDFSTAMGATTTASGDHAAAMGSRTSAARDRSLSIGVCNRANTSADATLLAAGNGTYDPFVESCNPSDALVLYKNGDLTISGSLTENSDRRLKTQIEQLGNDVLERLSRLQPVRFEFTNQQTHPSGEQVGLIAQDVQKEFPSLVSEGASGYLSLAYPKMTAVLLKGIQEQQDQLEKKQAQIDSLKEKVRQIQDLKSRLTALEAVQSPSALAGLTGQAAGLMLAFLLGGLLGAGLIWRRRE